MGTFNISWVHMFDIMGTFYISWVHFTYRGYILHIVGTYDEMSWVHVIHDIVVVPHDVLNVPHDMYLRYVNMSWVHVDIVGTFNMSWVHIL